jgi:SAM-dependent methyltransferase
MLARGRARVDEDPRVRLVEGDVSAAPREGFDVALVCLVLEHFERLAAPLAAAAAALRAGGTLQIFELHPAWWHDGGRAHYVVDGQERAIASWAHDEAEFARALPEHGLELVAARSCTRTRRRAHAASAKLRKRLGKPVLRDVVARRR